jgi:uncharacterized membrane protein
MNNNEQWNETWGDACESKPNKPTWSENKRWTVAILATLGLIGLIIILHVYNVLIHVAICGLILLVISYVILSIKSLVDSILGER